MLTEEAVIGAISLLIFALIFTVTIKYVFFVMRADNRGEGGILSLMALAQTAMGRRARPVFLLGVAGAALFSGEAMITPAISVMSAVEGLELVTHRFSEFVMPATMFILVTLFWVQSGGTARVAAFFGPIMIAFFLVIGVLGALHIADAPQVLHAFDPRRGVVFLLSSGWVGFAVLGSVFLAVTGVGGALRRHGPFRPAADPTRLDRLRAAGAAAQLSWPGRADPFQARGGRQSVLPARAGLGPASAGDPLHHGHDHRRPGRHHRGVFAGAAGHSARPAAASGDHAHIGETRGANLHRPGQPSAAHRRADPGHRLQELVGARFRLWHRRHRHHGDDDRRSPSSSSGANGAGRCGRRSCSSSLF